MSLFLQNKGTDEVCRVQIILNTAWMAGWDCIAQESLGAKAVLHGPASCELGQVCSLANSAK